MNCYPVKYTDASGSEVTTITNDGETLRMVVRGLEFSGDDFDSFEPPDDATGEQLQTFELRNGWLCSLQLEFEIPIPVCSSAQSSSGSLAVVLRLGKAAPSGVRDHDELSIALRYDGQEIVGPGTSGWFEDELIGIQKQLPAGVFMQACINCLYSDYSPFGHGMFGGMMCFRNLKDEYLQVTSKAEFFTVHDRHAGHVQETYLCPEFKLRIPGTGYRG